MTAFTALLAACHFVCPLLFFTDLTRNPYFTQIALLNVFLLAACAAYACSGLSHGDWRFPKTALDLPLACWLTVCAVTWTLSYFGHMPFFRDAIKAEGLRVFLFTIVNTLVPFYAAVLISRNPREESPAQPTRWAAFALAWALGWALYSSLKSPSSGAWDPWTRCWDPYGAFLWLAGVGIAVAWTRAGGMHAFWHLALVAGFLSSLYGVFQYFNVEWIWPKVLNPYGGRSVSTFGNPNFMSSYMVLLMPVALAYYFYAPTRWARATYAAVFLTLEACLLCSLTRSSWAGAIAAVALLFLSPAIRAKLRGNLQGHGTVICLALLLIPFWPKSLSAPSTPTVIERVQELSTIWTAVETSPYSPLYQRLLIWSASWLMGQENWLLGKGWGLFELFYPFYQGCLLNIPAFSGLRTHANNCHNEVLEIFSQTGVLGLGVQAWLWCVFAFCAWRWHRRKERQVWQWAAASAVAGMWVDNLLNVSMHFAVPAFLLWWQAGIAVGAAPDQPEEKAWRSWRPSRAASAAVALLVLATACWGGRLWWRQWNREVHFFQGFKLARSGRLMESLQRLEAAYRWHPRDVNANYELGNAYARSDQLDKALWAYREALKANAGYDEIYFNMGTVLGARLGRWEEALGFYRVSALINPISYELYVNLNRLYLRDPARFRTEAIESLRTALRFFPEDVGFLNNLGYLLATGGDFSGASRVWARALEANPELSQAELNLRSAADRAKIAPPSILREVARYKELEARIGRKDFSAGTVQMARDLAKTFPKWPKMRFYAANLELVAGNPGAAVEMLAPLVRAEPGNASLQLSFGQALAKVGRRQEAAAAFRAVLASDPGNAHARQWLQSLGQ